MKKTMKRLLSLLLSVMMLVTMFPISAFAAEPGEIMDSGTPNEDGPKHWLQLYQEYALSQISRESSGPRKARAASGSASPSFSIISWAGGTENRLTFANGAYLGDGMPKIKLNGRVAFCAEWNGVAPEGDYIQSGEGSDPAIKQILANYDNSGKSNADYAAAQAAIWAHLMGTSVASWGACPGRSSEDEIFNGNADYSHVKYNYITWSGGTQKLLTYDNDNEPFVPPDTPPDDPEKYRVEVTTDTSTETEVRNRKTYSYSDALGQITIRKHDQDEKSLDGALFDIDVAFSDGSHTTVNGWEVDNGARLFTWTHPKDNHAPATVTVKEVRAPRGYLLDPTPQTAVVAPTYTRVTHIETWTVTIVTETTSSTTIDIESGEVVSESSSSSSAETESDPQVEEFTDFVEGDRETTMTFVNQAMPCSLTVYKYETGNKGVALEGASFRIRYADPKISAQTWTETTNREGKIYIPLPYAGSLIVEELSAPAGYVMNAKTTYDVTVAKGEQKVLEIPNDKKAQLIVTKKDAQTGQLLAGATIKATLLRSNTPPFEAGQSFSEVTGADGRAVFTNLIPGEYRIEEGVSIAVASILTPFFLLVAVICSMLQGTASHNNAAVQLTFRGGSIPLTMPGEYKTYITEMRSCFSKLGSAISAVEAEMEGGNSLDSVRVKAVFYALYFGQDHLRLRSAAARSFVDCFVTYETRTRTVTEYDENGDPYEEEETYIVAVPIHDLSTIYANVGVHVGRTVTSDDSANITEIYLRVRYDNFDIGADMSLEGGNGTHDLIKELTKNSEVVPSLGSFVSPLTDGWRDKVTSEFGYRQNPTGTGSEGHTGLDMAVPLGTEIRAVKDGRVLFVRYKQTGYGYHVVIDHGGGLVTLYAHCSEILVTEGQTVAAGETIARSGSTGRSTGPHLHLEVIQDGVPQNPRSYL